MPHIDMIAFDFDGTLADSEKLMIPDMLVHLEEGYGVKLDIMDWISHGYLGLAGQKLVDKINYEHDVRIDLLEFEKEREHRAAILINLHGLNATPNLEIALNFVKNEGFKRCVVSNALRSKLSFSLPFVWHEEGTNLADYFGENYVSARDDVPHTKPAPDAYLFAAEMMGVKPENALAVEDSVGGAVSALNAGFITFGYVGTSYNHEEHAQVLKDNGVKYILWDWNDFPRMVHEIG